jgi:hypothetical protein
MFTSEKISSNDFIEGINSENLKPASIIFGKVKKSDKDSEVLFAFKGDKSNWTRIPANMIEHAHLIKSFTCKDEKISLVKIHLKIPSDPEAKVFHDLLSSLQAKVMKWHMKKMMIAESRYNNMKNGLESQCGHKKPCKCGH